MMQNLFLSLLVYLPGALSSRAAEKSARRHELAPSEQPINKVMHLLEDIKAELDKESEDDKKVYETLKCWCGSNNNEKTKAIDDGEARMTQLDSLINQNEAGIQGLQTKLIALKKDNDENFASKQRSQNLRIKENKAFHEEQLNLQAAISACGQTRSILNKHNDDLGLIDIKNAARYIHDAHISEMIVSSRLPNPENSVDVVRTFLNKADKATSAVNFLAMPGQNYEDRGGEIYGVLQELETDFKGSLKKAEEAEAQAVQEYNELVAAKRAEIKEKKKQIIQLESQKSELEVTKAEQEAEYEDIEKQVNTDKTFLRNLDAKCKTADKDFQERTEARFDEMKAVEETINILAQDIYKMQRDALAASTSFLQVGSSSQPGKLQRRAQYVRAVSMLQKIAGHSEGPHISLLAAEMMSKELPPGADPNEYVAEHVKGLIEKARQEGEDDVRDRNWCRSELHDKQMRNDELKSQMAEVQARTDEITQRIDNTIASIKKNEQQVDDTNVEMDKATKIRAEEKENYRKTITSHRVEHEILTKALERISDVYSLLEQPGGPHIQTSGTETDAGNAPARFANTPALNKGGAFVVRLLKEVIADAEKNIHEAETTELDSQGAYEDFMRESRDFIKVTNEAITESSQSLAKAKQEAAMLRADLRDTEKSLEDLIDETKRVHKICDFLLDNFDERQEKRKQEILELESVITFLKAPPV